MIVSPENPGYSNPNLLDNWYFLDPINQRKQTSYSGFTYTIDRWKSAPTSDHAKSGIIITDEGIQPNEESGVVLVQYFEADYIPAGARITFSMLVDEELLSGTSTWDGDYKVLVWESTSSSRVRLSTYASGRYVQIHIPGTSRPHFKAVKLELGNEQTLAYKDGDTWVLNDPPPDKEAELSKCQRYQVVLGETTGPGNRFIGVTTIDSATSGQGVIWTPVQMRANPKIVGTLSLYGGGNNMALKTVTVGSTGPTGVYVRVTGTSDFKGANGMALLYSVSQLILDANL